MHIFYVSHRRKKKKTKRRTKKSIPLPKIGPNNNIGTLSAPELFTSSRYITKAIMTSVPPRIAGRARRANKYTSVLFPDLDSPSKKLFTVITFVILSTTAAVTRPPTFTRLPRSGKTAYVYDNRENIELECRAEGDPRPVYSWTKDGQTIDVLTNPLDTRISIGAGSDGSHGNLKIVDPRETDQGYYQCRARNVHGVALSQVVYLKEAFMEQMPKINAPRVRSVGLNRHVVLTCNPPNGLPKAEIFWTKEKVKMPRKGGEEDAFGSMALTKRVTQDLEGNLHILSVQKEDENEGKPYICNSYNPTMRSIQQGDDQVIRIKENDISGETAPELVWGKSQLNTVAMKGQKLHLMCIFAGTPVPEVTWRRKGGSLPERRTKYESFNQELVIWSVAYSDQGEYECSATNGIGKDKKLTFTVQVQSKPFFKAKPMDAIRADEESYTLNCDASGHPPPLIEIRRNGEELDFEKLGPKRYVLRASELEITNLMKDKDTAVFQCNASNVHGYAFSNTYLNVMAESPEFTEPPEEMHRVVEDSDAVLKCRTIGAPKPKITWKRGAQKLSGGRYQIQDNGDLKIFGVKHSDQGKYTCQAVNKFGEVSDDGELEIHRKTVIQVGPESVTARISTEASFRCVVEGDASLALSVTWLKDGEKLTSGGSVKVKEVSGARSHAEASVEIHGVADEHDGDYACVATTDLDQVEAEAHLDVLDVPKPPEQPRIVTCKTRKAEISWEPSSDGRSPILNYIIQFNTTYDPDFWEDADTDVDPGTFIKAVDLSPWANYTFRVIARNKLGVSRPSPVSRVCTTGPDTPDKNPDGVKGEGNSPNNLVIYWQPMPLIEHNGDEFSYQIKYRRQNQPEGTAPWSTVEIQNWKQDYFPVPNQPTFQPYDIMVTAFNKLGQAKGTAEVYTGWSGEAMPKQAPTNFACEEPSSPTTTTCTWDEVPRRDILGKPAGYQIQFWEESEGENKMQEVDFPYDSTSGTISLLKPYSEIVLQIRVRNNRYTSEPSRQVTLMTPEGRPSPVLKLKAIPVGKDQFKVSWTAPRHANGILQGYKLTYREVAGLTVMDEVSYPEAIKPDINSIRLDKLKENTMYRIVVRGFTRVGEGEENFCEEYTTVRNPPAMPRLRVTQVEETSMNVTILPAEEDNSGTHFYIEYGVRGKWSLSSGRVEATGNKVVQLRGLKPGTKYQVRVAAYNGETVRTVSNTEIVLTTGDGPDTRMGTITWFIIILVIIIILIIILILVCLIKRNRGGKYPVQKKELEAGCEVDREGDAGFEDFTRMGDDRDLLRGSQGSLDGSLKPVESDIDSLGLYGDGEAGKFNEEGSFIGQYVPDSEKKRMADSREDVVDKGDVSLGS